MFYEQTLADLYQRKHASSLQDSLLFIDTDFNSINKHLPDQFEALFPLLLTLFSDFNRDDIDSILIPNITLHSAIDKLELSPVIKAKINHPILIGIQSLKSRNITEITLAGTRHTMQSEQLSSYFETAGINVHRILATDITSLDKIRIKVYETGFSELLMKEMQNILNKYSNVVIACTELSILNRENDYHDLTRLQIEHTLFRLENAINP